MRYCSEMLCLDAVALLGALGVAETVERADQIAGDAADAVERLVLVMISQLDIVAIQTNVDESGSRP